jgi:hypothetical protein
LLAPLHGSDWDAPALGDFYFQAFDGLVSLPVAGYDYNSGWISFCWRDSHPLEWQLASLHDQLTPEVAHHAFHNWIRGYYLASQEYRRIWQEKEALHWEFISLLFDATNEIEREKMRRIRRCETVLDDAGIAEFLDDEITCSPVNADASTQA